MIPESEVKQIELTMEEAKEKLKDVEALDALLKNKHFVHLIKKRYLQEEPVRLVHLLQSPAFQTPERQADLQREMQTISGFLQWLTTTQKMGDQLREDVRAAEAELEYARQQAE